MHWTVHGMSLDEATWHLHDLLVTSSICLDIAKQKEESIVNPCVHTACPPWLSTLAVFASLVSAV